MQKQKGFSLIELLIVVAIILVIAAIAIPNLLRSKMAANEASAVYSLRAINTAQVSYFSTYGLGYAALINLSTPAAGCVAATSLSACLIDNNLGIGAKSGYNFTSVASGGAGNDALNGGAGNDILIFAAGFGNDTVTGFDSNPVGGQDLIDITAYHFTAANFAANVLIAAVGTETLITIAADQIHLLNVASNTVNQTDFIL